VTHN